MENCIFCQIAAKQVPAELIYENEEVVAFPDHMPSAPVHLLIVPKEHIPSFLEIGCEDSDVLIRMLEASQRLIRERRLESGYRLIFNGGSHQHVPHLHWHLIAP